MEKYKGLGIKLTPQRLAVLEYLDGNKTHPSAEEIYEAILKRHPTTSFATVYNTLNTLRDKGVLLELSIDCERKRFDSNPSSHHHLMCVECKSIIDINKKYSLELSSDEAQGFEVIGMHVEFHGLCPECRSSKGFNKAKPVRKRVRHGLARKRYKG